MHDIYSRLSLIEHHSYEIHVYMNTSVMPVIVKLCMILLEQRDSQYLRKVQGPKHSNEKHEVEKCNCVYKVK